MSLLRFKGKIRIISEDDMELEELDIGIKPKYKEWVWRAMAVPIEEIYKVIAYSSTKSVIQLYDGEKILVAESFEELCNRWEKLRVEFQLSEDNWPVYNQPGESFEEDSDG